jgi:hypothetical protein
MTSLLSHTKQNHNDVGYYINVGSLIGLIYQRGEPSGNTGLLGGTFSTASWCYSTTQNAVPGGFNAFSTTLANAGRTILKDLGRTVVSSNRTFRKIQYVVPNSLANSTFGVSGQTTTGESYLTGYIELGFGEGQTAGPGTAGGPAPVAHYGR